MSWNHKTCLLTLMLLLLTPWAWAGEFGVVINGKSHHFDRNLQRNEKNYGLGAEYELGQNKKWVRVVVANGFIDSMDHMSYMAGFGVKRRISLGPRSKWYFDAGVVGFVMIRREYHGHRPFPGALPTLTIGTKKAAVNLIYVPGYEPITEQSLFLQLKINVSG